MKITKKVSVTLFRRRGSRQLWSLLIVGFLLAQACAGLLPLTVHADQVSSRSITMSDSGPSNGVAASNGSTIGTGTAVTYKVGFTTATTGAVKGIVVSFCDNTPFIGDTGGCSAITGFSVGTTVVAGSQTGISGTYTAASSAGGGASGHVLTLTNSSATSIASGTAVTIAVSGFTNPSTTNHTFYARVLTYASDTTASAFTDASPGAYTDYGGIALSTANVITITARVLESLSFCVSKAAPTSNCGGISLPALTIGHGTANALDSSVVDTATAYSQVSTNASNGVIIRLINSNKCGGLSRIPYASQTATTGCDIPPVNNNSGGLPTAATQLSAGTAAFGVNVSDGTAVGTGSGSVVASTIYKNASSPTDTSYVGMNMTASGSNPGVSSTYGDLVASSTAPVNNINNKYTFNAAASNLTPNGVYTANVALVATGTY